VIPAQTAIPRLRAMSARAGRGREKPNNAAATVGAAALVGVRSKWQVLQNPKLERRADNNLKLFSFNDVSGRTKYKPFHLNID
jgi:hypothetical protein